MSDEKKVVFLAHRNDNVPTNVVELLSCGRCGNKTWIVKHGIRGSNFPFMECACCGEDAGYFGWVDHTEALTE